MIKSKRWLAAKLRFEAQGARFCECECGQTVAWAGYSRGYSRFVRGHRSFLDKNRFPLDPTTFRGGYIIGAVCGDGCVSSSGVMLTKGSEEYVRNVERLMHLDGWKGGFGHGNGKWDVRWSSVDLRDEMLRWKRYEAQEGKNRRQGLWEFPANVHAAGYVSGLLDTDGGFERSAIVVYQKDNGNLEKALPLFQSLGVSCKIKKYPAYWGGLRCRLEIRKVDRETLLRQVVLLNPDRLVSLAKRAYNRPPNSAECFTMGIEAKAKELTTAKAKA